MAGVLVRKTAPTGVDKVVDSMQVKLHAKLLLKGWTDFQCYPRAYRNLRKGEGDIEPQKFISATNYKGVLLDQEFTVSSFVLVSSVRTLSNQLTTATVSFIFQADLNKLFSNAPDTSRFDEELINDVHTILGGLGGRFDFKEFSTDIPDVYREFDSDELLKRGDNNQPCNVARFDIDVTYSHTCTDVYAKGDCTFTVTVSTEPETSVGADDGTATADVEDSQGNLSFLWNDPSAQTTQTATGLAPASYLVTVTDDNSISCIKDASGTVEAAAPPPVCNLAIDSIDEVSPTTDGGTNGTLTANVSGNTGIVGYGWTDLLGNTQTVNPAVGLSGGETWFLNTVDQGVLGCVKSEVITIPYNPPFGANVLRFDGVNDHILIGMFTIQSEDDFTINLWGDTDTLAENAFIGGTSKNFFGLLNSTTIRTNLNNLVVDFTVPTLSTGTWYMYTLSRISGTMRLYVNAVESTTGGVASTRNPTFSKIGGFSTASKGWDGEMAEFAVSVFVGATQANITALYASGSGIDYRDEIVDNCSFYWKLNGSGTSTVAVEENGIKDGVLIDFILEPWVPF